MSSRSTLLASAAPYLAAAMLAALPLFAHLDALPIRLWDESRLAFNALEMARGDSHPLVPTYGGQPEMWNTKPPLLIWIQALMIRTLGENELAVRLPSVIAALATCFLLVRFAQKRLGRPWLGVLAVGVLVTARGYVSLHGARTGDYDALMTLFATGYGLAWFLYCEGGSRRMLWTAAFCIAGAALTKGVGGLLPLPALALYAAFSGRHLRPLSDPYFYLAIIATGAVVGSYYLAREGINPGYLGALRNNELSGRFSEAAEKHTAHWGWYAAKLFNPRFWPWALWWAAGALLAAFSKEGLLRRLVLFTTIFCAVHLIVISTATTKLEWYDLPVYPFTAFTAAIGIYLFAGALQRGLSRAVPASRLLPAFLTATVVLALFFLPYWAALQRAVDHALNPWDPPHETFAAEYLQQLHRGARGVRIDAFVWKDYYASIAWYRSLLYGGRGGTEPTPLDSLQPGQQVYTFQESVQQDLLARYTADTVDRYKDVVLVYRITARK